MESHNDTVVSANGFIYMGSGCNAPWDLLSNFSKCHIEYPVNSGYVYPSAEHAFQAQLIPENKRKEVFGIDGLFGSLEVGYTNYFTLLGKKPLTDKMKEDIERKVKYWGEKKNGKVEKTGIVAKIVSKREWLKKHLNIEKIDISAYECDQVFKEILMVKYSQEKFKNILLKTDEKTIVEFDRMAEKRYREGKPSRWAAVVLHGKIMGHNQMGAILMAVRHLLRESIL